MKLLIATTNRGKVREFREMLGDGRFDFDDLAGHAGENVRPVEETGRTFRANAMLKAAGYAERFKLWTLADDSGLEVDALRGAPGVQSARWAEMHGAGKGDRDNNLLLIKQLRDFMTISAGREVSGTEIDPWPIFPARFVCVLALADPRGRVVLTTTGHVEGRIIPEPRGEHGFGYDPHFYFDSLAKTTAELSPDEKHRISHRGQALRRMRDLIDATIKP